MNAGLRRGRADHDRSCRRHRGFQSAAGRIFGYPVEDVIGRNIGMLVPEPYHSAPDGYSSGDLGAADAKVIGLAGDTWPAPGW